MTLAWPKVPVGEACTQEFGILPHLESLCYRFALLFYTNVLGGKFEHILKYEVFIHECLNVS